VIGTPPVKVGAVHETVDDVFAHLVAATSVGASAMANCLALTAELSVELNPA